MIVGVIGGRNIDRKTEVLAFKIGQYLAEEKHIIVCGGMRGVMDAVCRGAKSRNGMTIGILPGNSKDDANPHIDIPIVTAMSHARNAIIVRTADVLVAIDGSYGTLSEIALALACGKRVLGVGTWDIDGVEQVKSPEELYRKLESMK